MFTRRFMVNELIALRTRAHTRNAVHINRLGRARLQNRQMLLCQRNGAVFVAAVFQSRRRAPIARAHPTKRCSAERAHAQTLHFVHRDLRAVNKERTVRTFLVIVAVNEFILRQLDLESHHAFDHRSSQNRLEFTVDTECVQTS